MKVLKVFSGLIAFIVIGHLGFVLLVVFEPDIENCKNRIEFNSEQWKSWKESEASMSLRWDMTHSLTKNYELIGMSTDEVIELLGNPSSQSNSNLRFYLGMSRHSIDTGSLILEIEDGKVVNYKVWSG